MGRNVRLHKKNGPFRIYAQSKQVTSHLDIFAFPAWLLAATVLFALVILVLTRFTSTFTRRFPHPTVVADLVPVPWPWPKHLHPSYQYRS